MNPRCDVTRSIYWTDSEICEYYDRYPNISNLTLAGMVGLTGSELKEILLKDPDK